MKYSFQRERRERSEREELRLAAEESPMARGRRWSIYYFKGRWFLLVCGRLLPQRSVSTHRFTWWSLTHITAAGLLPQNVGVD